MENKIQIKGVDKSRGNHALSLSPSFDAGGFSSSLMMRKLNRMEVINGSSSSGKN